MKALIISILLIMSVSFKGFTIYTYPMRVQYEVYKGAQTLLHTASIPVFMLPITIDIDDFYIQGTFYPGFLGLGSHIVITQGLVDFFNGHTDRVVWVIAHEIGHYIVPLEESLKHTSIENEIKADLYANKLMKEAGFGECTGSDVMKQMFNVFGDVVSETHPLLSERYEYLRCNYE